MALHSNIPDNGVKVVCGFPILPLRTKTVGPAPFINAQDIIDEAFKVFRINVLFKNFQIKNSSDKALVYLLVYLTQCFKVTQNEKLETGAKKRLGDLIAQKIPGPKDKGFFMGSMLQQAKMGALQPYNSYLRQLKQQTALRFLEKFYSEGMQVEDFKFWSGMSKKKFMGFNFSALF